MSRIYTIQDLQTRTLSELHVLRGALQRDFAKCVLLEEKSAFPAPRSMASSALVPSCWGVVVAHLPRPFVWGNIALTGRSSDRYRIKGRSST
jgi:hypothetical protein